MNSDIPMCLTDFATALPPAELRSTCEFRRSVLFPTAITCGVAAGVFSLASLIYGTYRVSVALDWNYILVPILSGCFLHPVLSVGAGGLGYLAVWKLGNRLLVDKTSQLEGQIEEWRTQLHTAVNEIHLRTVTQLATSDQLGRLMKSMNLPQQLMLRQLVGARTFESSVVPASGDGVRPYWSALHALTKPTTDIAALLANQQFRSMFRKRPEFVPAIGIMIGQCRKLTADLESQLREFTAAVRANDACVTKILRHVDLAHYDPRTARDDYTRISVGRDTYYGHPSIVSDGLPELPVEQAAVFEEYLRLMHGQVPDPTAMERLSPVQRLAMRGLI